MGKEGADTMRGKRPPLVYEGGVCKAPRGGFGSPAVVCAAAAPTTAAAAAAAAG